MGCGEINFAKLHAGLRTFANSSKVPGPVTRAIPPLLTLGCRNFSNSAIQLIYSAEPITDNRRVKHSDTVYLHACRHDVERRFTTSYFSRQASCRGCHQKSFNLFAVEI